MGPCSKHGSLLCIKECIRHYRPHETLLKVWGLPVPQGLHLTPQILLQVKDIVAYAARRFITVVPEIELPGHCGAALACYPHLSCERA